MNRSRSGQRGFSGLWRRNLVKMVYATGASAIGVPGWPELAFCTASIARARMVSIESASTLLVPRSKIIPFRRVQEIIRTLLQVFFLEPPIKAIGRVRESRQGVG